MLLRASVLLSFLILSQGPRPPSASEVPTLIQEYLNADSRTEAGFQKRQEILTRLALTRALTPSKAKDWTRRVLKLGLRGKTLPKKSGRFYFYGSEKSGRRKPRQSERTGLFIVGGEHRRPKGLLIAMHGGGVGAGSARACHSKYHAAARKLGWVAIFPEVLAKTEHGWTDSGTEEFVIDLLDAALRTWKLDPSKVYFAGHSMGGYGTWTLGAHHADRVAALAPSAGAPTPIRSSTSGKLIDVQEGVIPNLRNVPIVIYQSTDDPNVPPGANQIAVKKLAEAKKRWGGFDYEYWEVNGRGHGLPPGGIQADLAKIAGRRRNAHPKKVVWQPVLSWKHQFYWLYWTHPVARAIVVAEVAGNTITVTCDQDADGLSVLLDDHLVDMSKEVVVKLGEKEVYRAVPERSLATIVMTATRNDPELVFQTRVPLTASR